MHWLQTLFFKYRIQSKLENVIIFAGFIVPFIIPSLLQLWKLCIARSFEPLLEVIREQGECPNSENHEGVWGARSRDREKTTERGREQELKL